MSSVKEEEGEALGMLMEEGFSGHSLAQKEDSNPKSMLAEFSGQQ